MTGDQDAGAEAERDFEQHLRSGLREAAGTAPAFDVAGWDADQRSRGTSRSFRRPAGRRPLIAVAAAILAVIVAGGLWLYLAPGGGGSPGGGAEASCAEVLFRNHHSYQPYDTVRVPRHGKTLGRAYWCQDTGPDTDPSSEVVYAVPGVAADDGFSFDGRVWLRTELQRRPPAVRKLQTPVGCRRSGRLTGQLEQFNGRPAGNPVRVRVPYTVGVRIHNGLGAVGMQAYDSVRVSVRVRAVTRNAAAIARLAARAESQPQYVRVAVVCHGDGFVATAIRRR